MAIFRISDVATGRYKGKYRADETHPYKKSDGLCVSLVFDDCRSCYIDVFIV